MLTGRILTDTLAYPRFPLGPSLQVPRVTGYSPVPNRMPHSCWEHRVSNAPRKGILHLKNDLHRSPSGLNTGTSRGFNLLVSFRRPGKLLPRRGFVAGEDFSPQVCYDSSHQPELFRCPVVCKEHCKATSSHLPDKPGSSPTFASATPPSTQFQRTGNQNQSGLCCPFMSLASAHTAVFLKPTTRLQPPQLSESQLGSDSHLHPTHSLRKKTKILKERR